MPAPYNMSLLANQTNFVGVMQAANTYTGGLIGVIVLLIIGIALFFSLRGDNRNAEALTASTFAIMILSILLTLIKLCNPYIVGACVFLFIGSLVALIMKR